MVSVAFFCLIAFCLYVYWEWAQNKKKNDKA